MSGNTNPNFENSPLNFVGDFSSLSARAQAYILSLVVPSGLSLSLYQVAWAVGTPPIEVVPAQASKSFVPIELVLVSKDDVSGFSGQYILRSCAQNQSFNWSDVAATLNGNGKVARILLDGLSQTQGDAASNVTIENSVSPGGTFVVYVQILGFYKASS